MIYPEKEFQSHLAAGRFMLLRSKGSGRYVFYPRVLEPGTGALDLEWVEARGTGVVYSSTVIRHKTQSEDYNVAIIDLDEGVRMMSRVEGLKPEEVKIGLQVVARIVKEEESHIVVFHSSSLPIQRIDWGTSR